MSIRFIVSLMCALSLVCFSGCDKQVPQDSDVLSVDVSVDVDADSGSDVNEDRVSASTDTTQVCSVVDVSADTTKSLD